MNQKPIFRNRCQITWLLLGELGGGNRGMPATFFRGRLTGETDLMIHIPIAITLRQTFPGRQT